MTQPRVLLVEDYAPMRFVVRMLLEQQGWELEEAESGEAALDRDTSCYDVVVLDYRMPPGPSGIEVARRLRESGEQPRPVLYSAYLSPEVRADAEELGIPAVEKGDHEGLVAAVRELLGRPRTGSG